MTVCERHLEEPPTVHAPLHGMGAGIPFIEIADQIYGFRSRCSTVEIDRFDHIPGGIEGAAGILMWHLVMFDFLLEFFTLAQSAGLEAQGGTLNQVLILSVG